MNRGSYSRGIRGSLPANIPETLSVSITGSGPTDYAGSPNKKVQFELGGKYIIISFKKLIITNGIPQLCMTNNLELKSIETSLSFTCFHTNLLTYLNSYLYPKSQVMQYTFY